MCLLTVHWLVFVVGCLCFSLSCVTYVQSISIKGDTDRKGRQKHLTKMRQEKTPEASRTQTHKKHSSRTRPKQQRMKLKRAATDQPTHDRYNPKQIQRARESKRDKHRRNDNDNRGHGYGHGYGHGRNHGERGERAREQTKKYPNTHVKPIKLAGSSINKKDSNKNIRDKYQKTPQTPSDAITPKPMAYKSGKKSPSQQMPPLIITQLASQHSDSSSGHDGHGGSPVSQSRSKSRSRRSPRTSPKLASKASPEWSPYTSPVVPSTSLRANSSQRTNLVSLTLVIFVES